MKQYSVMCEGPEAASNTVVDSIGSLLDAILAGFESPLIDTVIVCEVSEGKA